MASLNPDNPVNPGLRCVPSSFVPACAEQIDKLPTDIETTVDTTTCAPKVIVNIIPHPDIIPPNVDMTVAPRGTGAFELDIPDNAVPGGNCRGDNAADLQMTRTVATQVASGDRASIPGGRDNTASGANSLAGGQGTISSGMASFAFGGVTTTGILEAQSDGSIAQGYVGGTGTIQTGSSAEGSRAWGFVGGSGMITTGNTAEGSHAWGHVATTGTIETGSSGDGASSHGYTTNSFAISAAGRGSHAEGSTADGSIIASGEGSHAEGSNAESTAFASHANGSGALARLRASDCLSSGTNFGDGASPIARGNSQCCKYVVRNSTTGVQTVQLFLDGDTGTLRLDLPDDTSWAYCIYVVARGTCTPGEETVTNADAAYRHEGLIEQSNGTTVSLANTKTVIFESAAGLDSNVDAGSSATNDALVITVTGDTNCNIRWTACVETTEVSRDRPTPT
uniref:Uncharacterized protein n=1 Tax=Marseillevirus LCMAC102 TaxID=2506603 RepID=A0A481YSZ9_9VIRU|nr:MAG: uncharacterized protein LCMAC102_01670 [Marseillevirus LCMAC102]